MNNETENVKQAKESFGKILDNKKYANIIRDDRHLATLLDMVEDGQYKKILDVGTGTGYLAFPLAEKYPKATVYGIDIAENIIAKNNDLVKEKGLENIIFMSFNGLDYPFEENTFDLVVTRFAFHHFPNVVDSIQQLHKLLVNDGKVLISDPMCNVLDNRRIIDEFMRVKKDGHIKFYSQNELKELFVSNGFAIEKQVITNMKFPFAKKDEYIKLFDKTTARERELYNITSNEGIVWIGNIDVGNTIFVKGR